MRAFDTDVLSDLLRGHQPYRDRLADLDPTAYAVPVVTAEEVARGWLAAIRKAESDRRRPDRLLAAYSFFARDLTALSGYRLLPYTAAADARVDEWRAAKVRVGTQDLRIAAVAVAHDAILVTRNVRDFDQIPGLQLEVWA